MDIPSINANILRITNRMINNRNKIQHGISKDSFSVIYFEYFPFEGFPEFTRAKSFSSKSVLGFLVIVLLF